MVAEVAGVVLAGGQSRRMGCDKSELEISGVSLTNHAFNILNQAGIKEVFISGKKGIQDQQKNKGPLAGIVASLDFLKSFKFVLFTTVDMPLLNKHVFHQLISHQNSKAVYIEKHFFPLLICNSEINRNCINQQLNNENLSIKNLLKQLCAESLHNPFESDVFLNANTNADWLKVLEITGQTG